MSVVFVEPVSQRANRSDLLKLLRGVSGLDRQRIGRVEIHGQRASIEIPDGWEMQVVKAIDGAWLSERRVRAWSRGPMVAAGGAEDHFQRLARLLELESRAEAERVLQRGRRLSPAEAEQSGETVAGLEPGECDAGLGGRFLLELVRKGHRPLPWTRLGVGSPVVLSPQTGQRPTGYRAVVSERNTCSLQVALDQLPPDLDDHALWRLDMAYDEVAVERQRGALERVRLARGDRLAELRDILVGDRLPRFRTACSPFALKTTLNAVQREAVAFALSAEDVALIHGPPGTGKTTVVVEIIRQAVERGWRVLASAPSNLAVDNVFERLLAGGVRAVRLGHPARVLPELRAHTLDLLVAEHEDVRLARALAKQAAGLFQRAERRTRGARDPGHRFEMRQDARVMLADAKRLELQAVEHILDTAEVLCATTTGLDSDLVGPRQFDLVVVDEACQSTEPGVWLPLVRADRVVLAGDHCQLPPTIVSSDAAAEGFGTSLFERLVARYGGQITRRLTLQYRMHASIMDFSSEEFYDGQLQASPAVAGHRLVDLPEVVPSPLTEAPVDFIDTAGAGYDEELEPDGESRRNPGEVEQVQRKVRALLEAGIPSSAIAVITPYAAQVRLLRAMLDVPGLEIDSVDGFQGREKEAVVFSLVRSNQTNEIGFLSDVRRTNVALTRAKRKLIVIGDSATLSGHPFYVRLLEYFERIGAYHTVWEEV